VNQPLQLLTDILPHRRINPRLTAIFYGSESNQSVPEEQYMLAFQTTKLSSAASRQPARRRLAAACLALAGAAALATPASAADLPLRGGLPAAPHVPMAVAADWSGFYVGLTGGGSFSTETDTRTTGTTGFLSLAPGFVPNQLKTGKDGFVFGAHAGYNQQIGGLVLGVEGDVVWMDKKKTAAFTGNVTPLATALTTTATAELSYLGTLRGRLGFAPTNQFHIYATGGLAFGEAEVTSSVVAVANPALRWDGKSSDVRFGYALGAGAEYAITSNLILRGEYLYYDLGDVNGLAAGNAAVRGVAPLNGIDYASKTRFSGSLARAAVSYKF
jgi:outer membrane immunogenic protein